MNEIYLDNSATTRVDELVAKKMMEMMIDDYGNPSSLHFKGTMAYNKIGTARCQVASVISANTEQIVFTSGGTESNNMAIFGAALANRHNGNHIVTTAIEHSSVLNAVRELERNGYQISIIKPNQKTHCMEAEEIVKAVTEHTILVSVMHVNNETGEILPIQQIVSGIRAKNPNALIHCDCVQSYGKYEFKLFRNKVDFVTASAHKLHGAKGVGALYIRDKKRLKPLSYGGKQENGFKTGTENTPGIVGFGQAAQLALTNYEANMEHSLELRNKLLEYLSTKKGIYINSPIHSMSNIMNLSVLGRDTSQMVDFLGMRDIFISGGSACERGARSHVLKVAGYPPEIIGSAIRISWSKDNTIQEMERFIRTFEEMLQVIA